MFFSIFCVFLKNPQGFSLKLQPCGQKNKYLTSFVRFLTAKTFKTFILDTFVEHVMKNVMVFYTFAICF